MNDKALDLACKELAEFIGACPGDQKDWCPAERGDRDCDDDMAKCWREYFLEKANEANPKGDSK